MTDYAAVLRELMIAGYEGAALLSAFDRLCAAIGGGVQAVPQVRQSSAPSAPRQVRQKPNPSPVVQRPDPVVHRPPAHAKAVGRTALGAMGLSGPAIAVGSQLLQHYNVKTLRCDPGIGSLAKSTRLSRRTIQRALSDLQNAGAFAIVQNGGHRHANRYLPVWPRLVEIAAGVSASAPDLTEGGDKSVTQNLGRKPDSLSVVGKAQGARRKPAAPADRRQLEIMMPISGGRTAAQLYAEIAETEARQRLSGDLQRYLSNRFMPDKAAFVAANTRAWEMDIGPVLAAEMARKGSGLGLWLRLLGWDQARAAG